MAPAPAPKPNPRRNARNKAAAAAAAAAAVNASSSSTAAANGAAVGAKSAASAPAAAAAAPATTSRSANGSAARCPNPDCDEPDIQEIEGNLTCASCGAVLDDTNFVNDVDFAETAAGAAVVQGSYVAGDKRYATTLDGRSRHAGGGMSSHELTLNRGRDALRSIALTVGLNESISDRAHTIYTLAANNNMIQGRGVREVAACCLYMSCRQENFDGASSLVLLIDFADAIRVNVYRLGKIYSDVKEGTFMTDDPIFKPTRPLVPVIDIEQIILRYCRKLDLGDDTQKVATDAARILRRMKRDWIVTGRTPSGLVGAALILGARMNNHRRTSREVTFLVKAAEVTVNKRIAEFMRTTAGNLTLDDFREYSDRIKDSAVPPAIYEREERKRKKRALTAISEDDGSEENPHTIEDTPEPSSRAGTEQPAESRRDADGFAIPAAPSHARQGSSAPAEGEASDGRPPSKRVKRKQATDSRRAKFEHIRKVITEEDLEAEAELEAEITRLTQDPDCLANMADARMHDYEDRARSLAAVRREAERLGRPLKRPYSDKDRKRDLAILNGEPVFGRSFSDDDEEEEEEEEEGEEGGRRKRARSASEIDLDAEEIGCHEFDDDREVANAIVGAAEVQERETLWVDENKAWMRTQQRKQITSLVAEAEGRGKDGQPQAPPPKRRAKRARRGDGSLMAGLPAPRTTSESVERMLDKAHKGKSWHKHINPEAIKAIYDEPDEDDDEDEDAESAAGTPAPAAATPSDEDEDEPATNAATTTPATSEGNDDDDDGAATATSSRGSTAAARPARGPKPRKTTPAPAAPPPKKPAPAAVPTLSGINKSGKIAKPKPAPKRRAQRQRSMTPAQAGQARALAAMADAGGEVSIDGLGAFGEGEGADGASAARAVLSGLGVEGIEGHVDADVEALYAEDDE